MKNRLFILLALLWCAFPIIGATPPTSWSDLQRNGSGQVFIHYYNSENFISDASGSLKGIEYDLLEDFFRYCEEENGVRITRTYTRSESFGFLFPYIQEKGRSGEFAACSFSMTPERMQSVQFSPKYIPDIEVLICSHNLPLVSDTASFIHAFRNTTALTVPNTTFDEDILLLKQQIPTLKIVPYEYATDIRDRIARENDLISYMELPNYLVALKNGINLKRQFMFKVERWGYGFIFPLSSDWNEPVQAYFNTARFRKRMQEILVTHLGDDVRELIQNQADQDEGINSRELALVNKEREIQDLELEKQKMKLEQEQFWRYIIIGGAFFVIVVAFLLYQQNRHKQKTNELLTEQYNEIKHQKLIIEEKNRDITHSIEYAERIQSAALSSKAEVTAIFPESFVVYLPKHTLSGDFYWVGRVTSSRLHDVGVAAVGDCTGHGVPGALLSILGINYFNIASRTPEINSPAEALNFVNKGVVDTFSNHGNEISDGMDAAMVAINQDTLMMSYATAINPVVVARNGDIILLKGDRFPIGKKIYEEFKGFSDHQFQLQKGDAVYLLSDGFVDQFGGEANKKYGSRQLKSLLLAHYAKPMKEQQHLFEQEIAQWKGVQEQTDDICIFGIRV